MLSDKRGLRRWRQGGLGVLRVPLPQDCGFFVGTRPGLRVLERDAAAVTDSLLQQVYRSVCVRCEYEPLFFHGVT